MRPFLALIFLAPLASCGAHPAQKTASQAMVQPRIMSLNPCIDAILVEVADADQIVAISHYSHDPAATSMPLVQARRFPMNFGTAEEVVALRPDIVLLSPHVDPATQAAIRASGVHVETVGVAASISESRAQIRAIAKVAGHVPRGEALVRRIDAALAAARPVYGEPPVPALIRQGEGLVPGAGTLADELLMVTGFRNMSADYGLAMWDMLPLEPMLAHPPSLLLTDRAGPDGNTQAGLVRAGIRSVDFPNRLLQCAGPSLIEAAQRLAAIRRQAGRA